MCIFICKFILTISILQENDTFFYFMFNMRTRLFIRDFITIWWIFFMGYSQRKRRAWVLFRDPECVHFDKGAHYCAPREGQSKYHGREKSLSRRYAFSDTLFSLVDSSRFTLRDSNCQSSLFNNETEAVPCAHLHEITPGVYLINHSCITLRTVFIWYLAITLLN